MVIDLAALHQLGYFRDLEFELPDDVFLQNTLNAFIELGKPVTRALRDRLAQLFDLQESTLRDNEADRKEVLHAVEEVQMLMPVLVQDYTDFYSSREHATNVGIMFRGKENALMPNWLHLPVGYHGRASSIVVSGEDIVRPKGQMLPLMQNNLSLGHHVSWTLNWKWPSSRTKQGTGPPLVFRKLKNTFSEWSSSTTGRPATFRNGNMYRSVPSWERILVPPSPWIVPWMHSNPSGCRDCSRPPVLDYLNHEGAHNFDLDLGLHSARKRSGKLCFTVNMKYLYWSMAQQLAHHTVNGCNVQAGI